MIEEEKASIIKCNFLKVRRAQRHAEESDIIVLLMDWLWFQESKCKWRQQLAEDQIHHLIPDVSRIHKSALNLI